MKVQIRRVRFSRYVSRSFGSLIFLPVHVLDCIPAGAPVAHFIREADQAWPSFIQVPPATSQHRAAGRFSHFELGKTDVSNCNCLTEVEI
jgi:hypothetical protein